MPREACGLAVTTLVIVDGGSDRTDQVAKGSGAVTFVLRREPRPRLRPPGRLRAVHRVRCAVRRHVGRRRAERSRRDPRHAPTSGRRHVGLRRGLARARTRHDDRPVPQGWRPCLLMGHERHGSHQADRHLQRLPGAAGEHARRRGLPPRPAAVPDGRASHHRHAARVAGQRTTDRLVAARLRDDEEGQELALRLSLWAGGPRDVVEGPQGAAPPAGSPSGGLSSGRSSPAPRRRPPATWGRGPRSRRAPPNARPVRPRYEPAAGWRGR